MWTHLRVAIGPKLPIPQVEPGEEGSVKLCWSRGGFYAEVELHPEDEIGRSLHEWFFRDRERDRHAGSGAPEPGAPDRSFFVLLRQAVQG